MNLSWIENAKARECYETHGHFGLVPAPTKLAFNPSENIALEELPAVDLSTLPESQGIENLCRIEFQSDTNGCAGFARSTAMETIGYRSTGGQWVERSPGFCYRTNQLMDQKLYGWRDRGDTGSTINGSYEAGRLYGACRLEKMPFEGVYQTRIPQEAYDDGAGFLIAYGTPLSNYDAALRWLVHGFGSILIAMNWNRSAQTDDKGRVENYRAAGPEDHALCIVDWTREFNDAGGRPYLKMANSHGKWYGRNGWGYLPPRTVDMIAKNHSFIGVTNMTRRNLRPRPIDWSKIRFCA